MKQIPLPLSQPAIRLDNTFYHRDVVTVAQELIGKRLVWHGWEGIITETEAYGDECDAASHAARGITPRSAIMFGPPGYVYVYLIYGMYHCLNIVTDDTGQAGAVLIRGLSIGELHLDGPGKICLHLAITKSHNGLPLGTNEACYLTTGIAANYEALPRVGINKATDKLWRFRMTTHI